MSVSEDDMMIMWLLCMMFVIWYIDLCMVYMMNDMDV